MTVAYFDCFSGISGDMILGALVDAGVPFEELKAALLQLPVDGYAVTSKRVSRCGIGATQVHVELLDTSHNHSHGDSHGHEHEHGHAALVADSPAEPAPVHLHHHHHHDDDHTHDHVHENLDHIHVYDVPVSETVAPAHEHSHSHEHDHSHSHGHTHGHSHHRGFSEIRRIIQESGFSDFVKTNAIEAFRRIAVEEAAVHESTIEEVHFHEVGAVDAIVDIVGSMWCIEKLGITRVLSSPVAVGSGTVRAAHGVMPVPAPATARLLKGKPIVTGPVSGELATPTGAAILVTLAEAFGPLDNFLIDTVAYGAGSREYADHPNYLRVLIGQVQSATDVVQSEVLPLLRENLRVLTAEIDDMPAELLGAAMESLLAHGALDCHFVPVQMKKNRPAVSLQVLATAPQVDQLLEIIFRQTSTLGVKILPCERVSLPRRFGTVKTPFGDVRTKQALWRDSVLRSVPEYEDCVALAKQKCKTVMEVYSTALGAANAESASSAVPLQDKDSEA